MSLDVEQHVRYRIANAPILEYPFPHQLISGVFPEDYYRELRRHLPSLQSYVPLDETGTVGSGAYRQRAVVELGELASEQAPAGARFWTDLQSWLLSSGFLTFLLQRFSSHATQRYGAGTGLRCRADARVVRDVTNYALGPHTDAPHKILSLLFYLPADESLRHLGTSIYAPVDPAFRCPGGPHYPFELFRRVMTAPYVPNTLFLFFKNEQSFHGVEPVRDGNVERNLLLYNISMTAVTPPAAPAR